MVEAFWSGVDAIINIIDPHRTPTFNPTGLNQAILNFPNLVRRRDQRVPLEQARDELVRLNPNADDLGEAMAIAKRSGVDFPEDAATLQKLANKKGAHDRYVKAKNKHDGVIASVLETIGNEMAAIREQWDQAPAKFEALDKAKADPNQENINKLVDELTSVAGHLQDPLKAMVEQQSTALTELDWDTMAKQPQQPSDHEMRQALTGLRNRILGRLAELADDDPTDPVQECNDAMANLDQCTKRRMIWLGASALAATLFIVATYGDRIADYFVGGNFSYPEEKLWFFHERAIDALYYVNEVSNWIKARDAELYYLASGSATGIATYMTFRERRQERFAAKNAFDCEYFMRGVALNPPGAPDIDAIRSDSDLPYQVRVAYT